MAAVGTEFVTRFVFKGALKPLARSNTGLGKAISLSAKYAMGVIGVVGAIAKFTTSVLGNAEALTKMSEEQRKKISSFNNSIKNLKFGMQSLSRQVAIGLAPNIQRLTDKFNDFLKKQNFVSMIDKFSRGFGYVCDGAERLIKFTKDLTEKTIGLKGAVILLGLAFAKTPMGKMIAIISAILLIIDDLIVTFQGGDSVIGDFFKKFFPEIDITKVLQDVVKWILKIIDNFKSLKSSCGDWIYKWVIKALDWLKKIDKGILAAVAAGLMLRKAFGTIGPIIGGISKAFRALQMVMAASPVILICIAIAVAVYLIIKNWDKVKAFFMKFIKWFSDRFPNLIKVIKVMVSIFISIWKAVFETFKTIVVAVINFFKNNWEKIAEVLKNVGGYFIDIIEKWVNAAFNAIESICGFLLGIKDIVVGIFTFDFEKIKSGFAKIIDAIANMIKLTIMPLIEIITSPMKFIGEKIVGAIGIGNNGNKIPTITDADMSMMQHPIPPAHGAANNNNTVNQQVKMEINTSDAKVAGQEAADRLNQRIAYAENMILGATR
ncbi:MAG: hypothetical protein LBH05_01565 [Deferribacteraceae bacterium]|jgi:phage-related protein|nr:hypothetical protein [Deferribacteraceae bacterium]